MSTPNALKDALHNTSRQNLRDEKAIIYARGMVVGVVSTFMLNVSFAVAIRILVEALPVDFLIETIPDTWKTEVFIEAKRQNKWNPAINKKPETLKNMDTLLTLAIKTLINNLKPDNTLIKVFEDLDEAIRLHETGKLRQDAEISTLKMWHAVIMETLAGEGYDFEAKEFLG